MNMAALESERQLYRYFAELLTYPGADLPAKARECAAALKTEPEAAAAVARFGSLVESMPLGRLEELYTSTFDLQPVCCPYLGFHLFGESYKRGAFMAKLKEEYRQHGFDAGNELPDHLCVLLRFLALVKDEALSKDLIELCVTPSLAKMVEGFESSTNPYAALLRALLSLLRSADGHAAEGAVAVQPAERS